MPSCVLRYCRSRYGNRKGEDFSLFSFPSISDVTREEWIKFVQIERSEAYWLPSSASRLCSKHFKSEQIYFGKTGRAVLRKGSIPYTNSEDDETNVDDTTVTPIDVYVSDSESIFDTPTEIALKEQVDTLQKQKIHHQVKIKKLGQRNKYLKRKIFNLKDLVKRLKRKLEIQKNIINALKGIAETSDC